MSDVPLPASLNMPVVFAALIGGAIVIMYGIKNTKDGLASSGPTGGATSSSTITTSNVPIAGSANEQQWAQAFLTMLNAPLTQQNVANIVAWENAEGGIGHNNPLNTTQDEPGATIWNSAGVKIFPTMEEGLQANASVLLDPANAGYGYPAIVAALKQGDVSTAQFGQIVGASKWGTSPFQ